MVTEAVPADAEWSATLPDLVFESLAAELEAAASAGDTSGEPAAALAVEAMSTEEALERYADLLAAGPAGDVAGEPGDETAEARALRARLLSDLAADTIAGLFERIERLEDENADERDRVEGLEDDLAEAEEVGGIEAFVRFILDDLGLAFGWGTVYLSVFLAWWNGQTPGK